MRSTAITTSAPIRRTASTGVGDTTPPSTSDRPVPSRTGAKTPGIAQLARMAADRSPSVTRTSDAVCRSQATAAKGILISLKLRMGNSRSIKFPIGTFDSRPRGDRDGRAMFRHRKRAVISAISRGLIPAANAPPANDPAEVPAIRSTGIPASTSTFSTPA